MLLKDIIQATKNNVRWGDWKFGEAMPRTKFPLSKHTSFRIRTKHHWCITTFDCLSQPFRLLVFYRSDKEEYGAYLAQIEGADSKVVARYEYHATHAGWHIHANCETDLTPSGRIGGNIHKRFPKAGHKHRRTDFGITSDEVALLKAAEAFGLTRDNNDLFGHGH